MNASIRLLSPLLLASLSLLSAACAGGTRAGASAPRLVREPMVLFDDGAARSGSPIVQQSRQPEHVRSAVVWNVNAVR